MSIMEKLSTYVSAICHRTGPLAVSGETVEKSCWQDQGFEVCREVTTYRFDNGVVIQRTIERDHFPSGMACAECWITYDVISNGNSGVEINPSRKGFENACRESFWLAYHTA